MKTVYLVRHDETVSNEKGIVQGANDELSEKGITQAQILANRLKTIKFDNLLVSDYLRTRQTISYTIPFINIEPEYTSLVRETKQPDELVGSLNTSEDFLNYYELAGKNLSNPSWRFSNEETFYDVVQRVNDFFVYINNLEGDTVVVTHGRFIIYVVMHVLTAGSLDFQTWQKCRHGFFTTNTGVTKLIYHDTYKSWKLEIFNDHAHFAD